MNSTIASQITALSICIVSSSSERTIAAEIHRKNEGLLKIAAEHFGDEWITPEIREALFLTERHHFIPRFINKTGGDWQQIDDSNLSHHLDTLYGNHPLCIYRDDRGRALSTISQPSLVLYMLSLLELEPGMKVFELGGGSGWNAALMSRLIGPGGHVYSLEIIPELVESARRAIMQMGIENVSIIHDDAYEGLAQYSPFDRGVFTASAFDLPGIFFDQIAENGILLFVTCLNEESDLLAVLRKKEDAFVSELHFQCRFVPVMKETPESESRLNIRSTVSACIQDSMAEESMKRGLNIDDFSFRIVPSSGEISDRPNQWIDKRGESAFIWNLPE